MTAMNTKREIPAGWNKISLERELTFKKGKVPNKLSIVAEPLLPYLTPEYLRGNSLPEAYYNKKKGILVEQGDVIILWDGSNAGEVFLAKTGLLSSTMCQVYQNGIFDKKYLYFFLKHVEIAIKSKVKGSGIPHVDPGVLSSIYSVIPQSFLEQQKIAEILSTLDEAIEKTDQLIEKHRRVKQGLMQDLFRYGIDEKGQMRTEKTHEFKDSPLGRIPLDWEVKSLEKCTRSTITYGIVQAGPHIEGGIPYIRAGDMTGDILIKNTMLCTSPKIARSYERSEVRAGDLVIAIRALVGKVLPVPQELDGANLTQGTAKISPKYDVNTRFLFWAINNSNTQKEISLNSKGTTFSEITLNRLRKINVVLPKNEEEQACISRVMDQTSQMIKREKIFREKLLALKRGLMEDLLSGTVRVNHLIKE